MRTIRYRYILFYFCFLTIFGLKIVFAQSYYTSQVSFSNYLLNSAYVGMGTDTKLNVISYGQMTQLRGTVKRFNLDIQSPLFSDTSVSGASGLGFFVSYDTQGAIKRASSKLAYSYHIRLNDYGDILSFGLEAGYLMNKMDVGDSPSTMETLMTAKYNEVTRNIVQYGFGVLYNRSSQPEIGISVPSLNAIISKDNAALVESSIITIHAKYHFLLPMESIDIEIAPLVNYIRYNSGMQKLNIGMYSHIMNAIDFMAFYDIYNTTLGFGVRGETARNTSVFMTYNTFSLNGVATFYSNFIEAGIGVKLYSVVRDDFE